MSSSHSQAISIHEPDALLPWGELNADFIGAIKDLKLPPDWLITSNATMQERLDHFESWFQATRSLINEFLWPKYDRDRQEWQGASTAFMQALVDLDLQVLLQIQNPLAGAPRFNTVIASPLRSLDVKTHHDMFSLEDRNGGSHMFDGFTFYDRGLDASTATTVTNLCWQADVNKKGNVSFLFKHNLQRPRPMQMALRSKLFQFNYRDAGTSVTPSMSSGHCLQGMLCVGAVIERFLDDRVPMPRELEGALGQWAVDIGDRRVMAGVHYPADNLCSWIVFLRMADFVFHRREVKKILSDAIKARSFVYAEISRWARTKAGETYLPALQLLEHSMVGETLDGGA